MYKPPRGTRDFMPDEIRKLDHVVNTIKNVFQIYGYDPVETPAFENWELLKAKCGEDVEKQIYKFTDKGGRELGLRFDFTVPLARIVTSNPSLPKPFRRYQISKVWRYERPEAERRFREFWQADIDIVGSEKPECEAEALTVASTCLEALGFHNFFIRLNNRKVLEGCVKDLGIPGSKNLMIFRIIDKLEKIGSENVQVELGNALMDVEGSEEKIEKLLQFIVVKGSGDVLNSEAVQSSLRSTISKQGLEELQQILHRTKDFGIYHRVMVDFSLARGLDYYTGPVFEILIDGYEDVGSVAGGGRYDDLIELYGGKSTPATGISLGVDRIVKLMERMDLFRFPRTSIQVFVAPVNQEMSGEAVRIIQQLRGRAIPSEVDVMGRKLSEQLKYVNKKQIPFVVIVGRDEVENGYVVVRDMERKEQQRVETSKLHEFFKM